MLRRASFFVLCAAPAAFATAGPHHDLELFEPERFSVSLDASYSLDVSSVLVADNGFVDVIYNVSAPAAGDWIGAYSPASSTANVRSVVPVKWVPLDRAVADYVGGAGVGAARFQLIDMRADYAFCIFTGGWRNGTMRACAPSAVAIVNAGAPRRARVLASAREGALNVAVTAASPTGAGGVAPTLWYSTDAGGEKVAATLLSDTQVAREDMCNFPATTYGFRDLGHTFVFEIPDALAAASATRRLFYTYGYGADEQSEEKELRVPPQRGATARDTRLVIFGDFGRGTVDYFAGGVSTWSRFGPPEYTPPAYNTTMQLLGDVQADGEAIDAIWCIGDISYASGYLAVWDIFLAMIEPLSERIAMAVTMGNHEAGVIGGPDAPKNPTFLDSNDSGGECSVATAVLLPLPSLPAPSPSPSSTLPLPYYTWTVGRVVMVALATEDDFRLGSPQWQWLQATLGAIDRSVTPFVVVSMHRPMYIASTQTHPTHPPARPPATNP